MMLKRKTKTASIFVVIVLTPLLFLSNLYAFSLPDTGQVTCHHAEGGSMRCQGPDKSLAQDGDYSINPPSLTDNGDGTITDNNTGLIWQKEDDDRKYLWNEALEFCENSTLAGHTDWRLPNIKELVTILNYEKSDAIDSNYFPRNKPYSWSSTESFENPDEAWVTSHEGFSLPMVKNVYDPHLLLTYVRCVRGKELSFGYFLENGDGTVSDISTELMWQKDSGSKTDWETATTYCEDLDLAGFTDWRLPNIKELQSIVDYATTLPSIDLAYFAPLFTDIFWSSTSLVSDHYPELLDNAWTITFVNGQFQGSSKSNLHASRCVRKILDTTTGFYDSGQNLGTSKSSDVALGDLDDDGDLDAFITNGSTFDLQPNEVWLNDGNGFFTDSGQDLGTSFSSAVALGDLDNDGDLDAFVANLNPQPNTVWLNDGKGNFTDTFQTLGTLPSLDVELGDLNGDGYLDAFVISKPCKVWLNDGEGFFTETIQDLGDSLRTNYGVALGDVDGDGDLDAFVAKEYMDIIWLNDGTGFFTDSGQNLGYSTSRDVELADLDNDNDLDAFVIMGYWPNKVWLNVGNGIFSDSNQELGSFWSLDIALGDVDGDSDLDAFVANYGTHRNKVWLNDGLGFFTDSGQNLGNSSSKGVELGDLDGDGDLDAFVANDNNQPNKVWFWGLLEPTFVNLEVNDAGTGSGTIISSPLGIDCGIECFYRYIYGSTITLTATPNNWSAFDYWSGDCSGTSNTCTVTMDSDKFVLANFCHINDLNTYYLDSDGDGYGDEYHMIQVCTQPAGYVTNNIDCNDKDPLIYPGAPEIKHDGIDQDCNGYDLTIEITKANYKNNDELRVEATSKLNTTANLTLEGYEPMKYKAKQQRWELTIKPAGGDPGTVTVCGREGCETAPTQMK